MDVLANLTAVTKAGGEPDALALRVVARIRVGVAIGVAATGSFLPDGSGRGPGCSWPSACCGCREPAWCCWRWVVRSTIYLETFDDWNRSSAGSHPQPVAA